MQEIEVIRQTRAFLRQYGLQGKLVRDLYTDAHPSLLADQALQPFQRFTLAFDSFSVHPDLVGRLNDGETTFAIEAKGSSDLIKGLAQADIYRAGFHLVLFASAGQPSADLLTIARQRQIGVLAVYPGRVDLIDLPPLHLPQLLHAQHIQQQFVTTTTLNRQFAFNLPTHYLCFAALLAEWHQQTGGLVAEVAAFEPFARNHYPVLPQGHASFRSALSGAEKLGLVRIQGKQITLSFVGQAAAVLLPDSTTLTTLHQQLTTGPQQTLARLSPSAAAVLRTLLYADPVAQFLIDLLGEVSAGQPLSLRALVLLSAERDRSITPLIFFNPEVVATITNDQGQLIWQRIQPGHYRSTTFMQYKSILKHAGIIKPHRLGGSSAKTYDPDSDLWELIG